MIESVPKKLRDIFWKLDKTENTPEGGKGFVFSVSDTEMGSVATVKAKIYRRPFKYIGITSIVVDEDKRGQSTKEQSGYGGTIIRQINEEIIKRGYFAALWNNTSVNNYKNPQVIDFYLKHGWKYFNESTSHDMYLEESVKFLKPGQFEQFKKLCY
jgi:ribosomal protein S18 acetylase RimI-like enzyme